MAKGRIEQEIALKVTGLEDLESIDKKIAAREKKKSKLLLEVDTGDASKKIDKLDGELDALKARKAELTITANVDKALASTKEVLDTVQHMDGETATVVLGIKAAELESTLSTVRTDLAQIDGQTVDVELRAGQAEQLKGELDAVKSKITEINGTPVQVDTSRASKGMNDISDSARGANSALANVVGNASQDFAALGGVAGTAGVALGQFGEYAADAKLSGEGLTSVLSSMGRVAVPLAAIGAVFQTITGVMGSASAEAERSAESVEQWSDALTTAGDAATNMTRSQQESGKIILDNARNFDTATKILTNIPVVGWFGDKDTEDITSLFSVLNTGIDAYNRAVTEGGASEDKFRAAVAASNLSAGDKEKIITSLEDDMDDYNRAQENVADNEKIFAQSTDSLNAALEGQADPLTKNTDLWKILKDDLADGVINNQATADAVNALNHELGLTPEQILAIAQAALDEEMKTAADATEEATEKQREFQEAAVESAKETVAAQEEMLGAIEATNEGIDEGAVALEGFTSALDQIDAASELDFSLMAINTVRSFDDIKGALEDAQKAGVDWSKVDLTPESVGELKGITPELQAVTEAVHGMRESIQTELTAAFDTGGIQGFTDKAAFFAEEIRGQFVQSFKDAGASTAEATAKTEELLEALGLLPEQVEITVKLSQAEAARKTLEIFKSDIDNLPTAVSTNIKTLWAKGDTIGALNALNAYLLANHLDPIDIESIINPPPPLDTAALPEPPPVEVSAVYATEADGLATMIDASQQAVDGTPVVVPVDGDPAGVEDVIDTVEGGNYDATVDVDGNPRPADGVIDAVEGGAYKATVTVGANPRPADGVIDAVEGGAYAATVQVGGNRKPADGVIDAVEGGNYKATVNVSANTSQYERDIATATKPRTVTIKANFTGGPQQSAANGTPSAPWPGGALAGEAGVEFIRRPGHPEELLTGPAIVPPGTRVTSVKRTRAILQRRRGGARGLPQLAGGGVAPAAPTTLIVNHTTNVNAAVVGNRYDVAKAVGQGNRDLRRLVGARGAGAR